MNTQLHEPELRWYITVHVTWLNTDARIGIACASVEAEGYSRHRYSITLLAGPDGYHVLEDKLAHGYTVGAHGVKGEIKDHPVPQDDVIDVAMESIRCRSRRSSRSWKPSEVQS